MITHQKWSVRLHFKGWDLGTECFQSVTILAWATYARYTLLSRLPVNFLVSLETMIFRIRFLNGFILDSSRARWCVWPHLPTPECCLLVWLHGLAGMTSCWQDDSSAVLYSWECQAALSPLLSPSCACPSITFHCLFTLLIRIGAEGGAWAWGAHVHLMFFVAPWIHSPSLKCFSFPGFDCPGCMRTKVHTLLFFSPNVNKTSFAGILPKWTIPMSSGIFQWNES